MDYSAKMNMYNFIEQMVPKEQKDIADKWDKIGLLDGAEGWERYQLACLLENQHLFNQQYVKNERFKQLSIAIVKKVFDHEKFLPYKLFSIQVMASANSVIYWTDKYNVFRNETASCRAKKLRTVFPMALPTDMYEGLSNEYQEKLEEDCNLTDVMSKIIRQEITKEIFDDIKSFISEQNQITHMWSNVGRFVDFLRIASSQVGKLVGGEANWIVVPKLIAEELKQYEGFIPNDEDEKVICKIGELDNRWIVCMDPDTDYVVFGKRNKYNPLDSGYFYCPYCPFSISEEGVIMTRYAKKIINNLYYGTIKIGGGPSDTK